MFHWVLQLTPIIEIARSKSFMFFIFLRGPVSNGRVFWFFMMISLIFVLRVYFAWPF